MQKIEPEKSDQDHTPKPSNVVQVHVLRQQDNCFPNIAGTAENQRRNIFEVLFVQL